MPSVACVVWSRRKTTSRRTRLADVRRDSVPPPHQFVKVVRDLIVPRVPLPKQSAARKHGSPSKLARLRCAPCPGRHGGAARSLAPGLQDSFKYYVVRGTGTGKQPPRSTWLLKTSILPTGRTDDERTGRVDNAPCCHVDAESDRNKRRTRSKIYSLTCNFA
jgi:hypothetical protein